MTGRSTAPSMGLLQYRIFQLPTAFQNSHQTWHWGLWTSGCWWFWLGMCRQPSCGAVSPVQMRIQPQRSCLPKCGQQQTPTCPAHNTHWYQLQQTLVQTELQPEPQPKYWACWALQLKYFCLHAWAQKSVELVALVLMACELAEHNGRQIWSQQCSLNTDRAQFCLYTCCQQISLLFLLLGNTKMCCSWHGIESQSFQMQDAADSTEWTRYNTLATLASEASRISGTVPTEHCGSKECDDGDWVSQGKPGIICYIIEKTSITDPWVALWQFLDADILNKNGAQSSPSLGDCNPHQYHKTSIFVPPSNFHPNLTTAAKK